MRKVIIAIACALFVFASTTKAQTYSINKLNYDYRAYSPQMGDMYNPGLCGVASFLIPGLGQIVAGETGRGLAFLGGYLGSYVLLGVGYGTMLNDVMLYNGQTQGFGMMLLGAGAMAGIGIWSIVDAVKVAKVNNLYIRDQHRTSMFNLQMAPYISPVSSISPAHSSAGMSLRLSF